MQNNKKHNSSLLDSSTLTNSNLEREKEIDTMTTSTAGWTSSSYPKEIERLTQLLWHYETVNLDQKNQLDTLVTSRDNLVNRIQQHEQEKKRQAKQMRSIELQLKYEKAATEGLRKKTGTLEKELIELKEILQKSQNHENDMSQKKGTLDEELKEERAYRLQLVHEKEKLREEIVRLTSLLQKSEQANVDATQRILDLQQSLETTNARADRQEKLIKVQTEEIISLNSELIRLKEKYVGKTRHLLEEQRSHADYHYTMDKMQEEISYLRKELTIAGQEQSERNIAAPINTQKTKRQNSTTKLVNAKTAARYDVSHFREEGTFTRLHQGSSTPSLASSSQFSIGNSKVVQSSLAESSFDRKSKKTTSSKKTQKEESQNRQDSPVSPARSWISDSFPQQSFMDLNQSTLRTSSSPLSRAGTANRGNLSALQMHLSPLATRDRPRDSLDYTQPHVDVDNETQAYFNNPDRVAFLQWIRTASRQASRQRHEQTADNHNKAKQQTSHGRMQHRVNDMKQIYQDDSVKRGTNGLNSTC